MPVLFMAISDRKIAELVDGSARRVALAVPGIRAKTAEALQRAVQRLGQDKVAVVVDCSEEVFRLGYGELEALRGLSAANCRVRQCAGLRAGVLVCDHLAWVFTPIALYVAPEVHSDETPNAVVLRGSAVDDVVRGIMGASVALPPGATDAGPSAQAHVSTSDSVSPRTNLIPADAGPPETEGGPEIGVEEVSDQAVDLVAKALEVAPPIPFDIARQVRVFEPYIQYVEINLRGCAIQRRKIEVPKEIQGLDPGDEINSRLRTTFELIERDETVSCKHLEERLNEIRDVYAPSLGKPWGRVLLRSRRREFDAHIAELQVQLDAHAKSVQNELGEKLQSSRKQLVDYYLPLAMRRPPTSLRGRTMGPLSEDQVRKWLDSLLQRIFPEPSVLVSKMMLEVQFRDVTYETLRERDFSSRLRKQFEFVEWDKPFREFDAARAREDHAPGVPASGA